MYIHNSKKIIYRLRQIQILSSSFLCCIFDRNFSKLLVAELICFLFSSVSFIIYWFYAQERYHLYGCRVNYEYGFPHICPEYRRPTGVDLTCSLCILCCIVFLILSISTPIVYTWNHWERIWTELLCNTVRHIASKEADIDETDIKTFQALLLKLEGFTTSTNKAICDDVEDIVNHRVLLKFSSSVYSSLYIYIIYRNARSLLLIAFFLLLSIVVYPCTILLLSTTSNAFLVLLAMILFHFIPLHSSLMIAVFLLSMGQIICYWHFLLFFLCWLGLLFGTQIVSWSMEHSGEWNLMKDTYKNILTKYVDSVNLECDVNFCLHLMGRKQLKMKEKCITLKDFARRIKPVVHSNGNYGEKR